MLFFIITRGTNATAWARRGTTHAKTSNNAIRDFRKLFRVSNSTQVRAVSGRYPREFAYETSPKPLTLRDNS